MIKLFKSSLRGSLKAPPSKSASHRQLIAAALSKNGGLMELESLSDDISATMDCLAQLGAGFEIEGRYIKISPIDLNSGFSKTYFFNAGDSGSTLRFVMPVAQALAKEAVYTGTSQLARRPFWPAIAALASGGVRFSDESFPIAAHGRFCADSVYVQTDISSQFLSGFLLAAPLLKNGLTVKTNGIIVSKPYADMTINVMRDFNMGVLEENGVFIVKSGDYISPPLIETEGDFSAAAFFLVSAVISSGSGITVSGLDVNSAQADKKIFDILSACGADIAADKASGEISARSSHVKPFETDITDCPDLFPPLCALAAGASGVSKISGAKRLALKESNRLKSCCLLINALGGKAEPADDAIIIHGKGGLTGGTAKAFADHRIAMAAAVCSLISETPVILTGENCVSKSYPAFFEDFAHLGGKLCHL